MSKADLDHRDQEKTGLDAFPDAWEMRRPGMERLSGQWEKSKRKKPVRRTIGGSRLRWLTGDHWK